jgi:hypothetical protein
MAHTWLPRSLFSRAQELVKGGQVKTAMRSKQLQCINTHYGNTRAYNVHSNYGDLPTLAIFVSRWCGGCRPKTEGRGTLRKLADLKGGRDEWRGTQREGDLKGGGLERRLADLKWFAFGCRGKGWPRRLDSTVQGTPGTPGTTRPEGGGRIMGTECERRAPPATETGPTWSQMITHLPQPAPTDLWPPGRAPAGRRPPARSSGPPPAARCPRSTCSTGPVCTGVRGWCEGAGVCEGPATCA